MAVSGLMNVRFLIMSDTHDLNLDLEQKEPSQHESRKGAMPPTDVILHCGDLTENGELNSHRRTLDMLISIDAELKFVIAGNHDISLDKDFHKNEGGSIDEHNTVLGLWRSAEARNAGVIYLYEGTHQFSLKSGVTFTVYASPWTPQFGTSAFQYPSCQDRYNEASPAWSTNTATQQSLIPDFPRIDVMMTHGPPKYLLDDTGNGNNAGCEHLRRAVCRAKPRLHCFGHVHKGWGAQKVSWKRQNEKPRVGAEDDIMIPDLSPVFVGKNSSRKRGFATAPRVSNTIHGDETLFVNAAIMDSNLNAPFVVNLELPRQADCENSAKRQATEEPNHIRACKRSTSAGNSDVVEKIANKAA